MQLHYYTDSGHGWVKTPKKLLIDLEIINNISHYSYQKNDFVYLEEDCDLSMLLQKLDEKKIPWNLKEHFSHNSKIRNFARFTV